MGSLCVGDAVSREGRLGADLDLVRVELLERNGIQVVALLRVV